MLLTELSRGGGVEAGISSMYSKLLVRLVEAIVYHTLYTNGDPCQNGKAPLICGFRLIEEVVMHLLLSGCDFQKISRVPYVQSNSE